MADDRGSDAADAAGRAPGRPRSTSPRELEVAALELFAEQGFEQTTVDQIAAVAGISRRTFFRYFPTKSSVLWSAFDAEVNSLHGLLAAAPVDQPIMDAVRDAVLGANHYRAEDVPELRTRMNLLRPIPALQGSAVLHYAAWEEAISAFVAARTGQPADSLYPLTVGRATLASCRAAFDRWLVHADSDLTLYLDAAISALAGGFAESSLGAEPRPARRRRRRD